MTNEAPATTAALQGRIADLEQQLKLSDDSAIFFHKSVLQ